MNLFDQEPIHLDLGLGVSPVSQSFDEISIVHTGNWTGFGSLSSTLKLAEGIRREFPSMPVVVYFTNEQDYMQVPQLVTGYDIHKSRSLFSDGIELALVTDAELRNHTARNCLSLISPIKPDCPQWNETRNPSPSITEFFTGNSKLNIYVQEYDCDKYVDLPDGIRQDTLYIDNVGNVHIVVRTGFGDAALGIHLDPSLGNLTADKTQRIRLLQKAGVKGDLEDLSQRLWGVSYVGKASYDLNWDYERKVVWSIPDYRKKVVVFAMTTFADSLCRGYLVSVKHPPKELFLEFMLQSDLPVCITGDASLAEVISMRKLFLYDSPPWKRQIMPALAEFAQKDATPDEKFIFASIFGFISGYYLGMDNQFIAQVNHFFGTNFSLICDAMEDYRKGKYHSSQEALLTHLKQTGRLTTISEQVVIKASEYLFFSYMDNLYKTQGKTHCCGRIFFCDGIPQYAYAPLLVSDVQYQTAMYRLFDKIHLERDLARNISKVIKEGIAKHCR